MVNEASDELESRKQLNRACKTDERFKLLATEDEDLAGLRDWFGSETAST